MPAPTMPPPSPTSVPPTSTPAGLPPVIAELPEQSISDGGTFPNLRLTNYASDPDGDPRRLTWSVSGTAELHAVILGADLAVILPDARWTGSETLQLQACDPAGLCDTATVVYTVRAENDPPIVRVADQYVWMGEAFPEVALDACAQDEESTADQVTWSVSGSVHLAADIAGGVLRVTSPDAAWHGVETLHLQACDPEGACGAGDATFAVLDETDVLVTYIGVDGFLIEAGGIKVLIDALHRSVISPATQQLLENAAPPFDDVDLVLATHNHFDHFEAEVVRRHMENNPAAVFVSTAQAVADLQAGYAGFDAIADRVVEIDLPTGRTSVQQTINGIDLVALNLTHGDERQVRNLGFLISLGGHWLFHTGDIDPDTITVSYVEPYGLPGYRIAAAFVPHFCLSEDAYQPLLREGIQARYWLPMHLDGTTIGVNVDKMMADFPNTVLLDQELQRWLMPR
jgi:L-ascorbate metabolism protein UlaG (beta-lactamase superfamily)